MRPAVLIPLLLVGTACGGSSTQARPPHDGATAQQADDAEMKKASRPLTHEECQQLGQSIIENCHGTNTRIATIEGWCSDVVAGVGSGTWVADCEKHIKLVDAVCFESSPGPRGMMDCDQAVSR
jgi:hypothetical protein